MAGSELEPEFLARSGRAREDWILEQVQAGRVPDFMRVPVSVPILVDIDTTRYLLVAPDYLCLGTDDDFLYAQCSVRTAQAVADMIGGILPTTRMVDLTWANAAVKLQPKPQGAPYDDTMASSARLLKQTKVIREQLHAAGAVPGRLVAGHAKDYVLSPRTPKDKTCIYGWHQATGSVIQPINARSHALDYVDYSQMARFFGIDIVDENWNTVADLPTVLAASGRSPYMAAVANANGPFPTKFPVA